MKKLTVVFAALALMLGFAGTASAQHHGNHGNGGYHNNGNYHHGNGDYRGNGGYHGNGGYRGNGGIVIGGGGIDIIIGGHRGYPNGGWNNGGWNNGGWNNGGWNNGGWNNGGYYPAPTRIVYERVYDGYGRPYTITHVARYSDYYRGYVWYDQNGNLRVN